MRDYQPLNLSQFNNVGTEFIRKGAQPPIGIQKWHGLPFTVGSAEPDPGCCFIGFGEQVGAGVTIPVGVAARYFIFAHALLESYVPEGESIGCVVANYMFYFRDGHVEHVPIRERFEVALVPTWWGGLPFLALPNDKNGLLPRYVGRWDQAGARLAETYQGWPHDNEGYYLWAWENRDPNRVIESVRLESTGRKFIVAAITLGFNDEEPFPRNAKREVKITLLQSEDASKAFDLEVDVDRGVATYPFALPEKPPNDFLTDDFKGWGEAQNEKSGMTYVEVTAIPSATITVKASGDVIGQANWGKLQTDGKIETPRLQLEIVDRGRNWVHVTILDGETDCPVPCRVHFRSPEGIPYQPHSHHNHVNSNLNTWHSDIGGDLRLGQITYAYIDGHCQGWLPCGEVIVDVARGFEYEPLRTRVRIEPGQRELTLRLKRWTNMNVQRWFSGDSHVHFLGAQGAHREAQGEDLNVVNLLQSQWGHLFTNTEDGLGLTTTNNGQTLVYCSQENRQHMLGHLTMWGLREPVMPWCTDGPDEAELGGALEETMAYWADACRAQGGTVIIPHLPNPNCEPAVLIATGRADAVEMIQHGNYEHLEYYRYLNCGYRLPLVGGTDKMSSSVPVGLYRTYAYIPEDQEFTYENWCRAVRAGRTFLSGGPMIRLSVNGVSIGDTLQLPHGGGTLDAEATAESIFPLHNLEIVQQGHIVASTEDIKGARRLHLKTSLKVDHHTWLAARCCRPDGTALHHHDKWQRGMFAHTSPIYIAVDGDWWLYDHDTAQYMLTLIDGGLAYIRQRALHYPPGTVTHHHGQDDHLAYLEKPFHEAQLAIQRRGSYG